MPSLFSDERCSESARALLGPLAERLGARVAVRLWDGSRIPLGSDPDPRLEIRVAHPGVLGSLLRRPTAENLVRRYATGQLDFAGGDLLELGDALREKRTLRGGSIAPPLLALARHALPLLLRRAPRVEGSWTFPGSPSGAGSVARDNRAFIAFHYDLPSDFFALFLDPLMQYSCGYFTSFEHDLERAQRDKLEMVCRKLRLAPGERLLDVGCGWGGLVCYAAQHYGVRAHGVTLSGEQCRRAQERIRALGLEGLASVEQRDYATLEGRYDKIASVAMFEHVGLRQLPEYFAKLHSLLADDGILLNHGIANRAKQRRLGLRRGSRDTRLTRRYLLPGLELTHLGNALGSMERSGFEIADVEGWRAHYAATARHWVHNLAERREQAVGLIGQERYRLCVLCLAGLAWAFESGSNQLFQVVATRRRKRATPILPPTRADLYR